MESIVELRTKLKVIQLSLDGERRSATRSKELYEREVAWSSYLLDMRDRLMEYIEGRGHSENCASRHTEGDKTCDCGYDEFFEPQKSAGDE